ncbi:MAG: hypothetical protein ACLGHF_09145 [Alphaproteobacteria bacterium]
MGFLLAAYQGPEQSRLIRLRDWLLSHACLQCDPQQGRCRIAIRRQLCEAFDQAARQAHDSAKGMIQIDPFKSGSKSLLNGLNRDGLAFSQKDLGRCG